MRLQTLIAARKEELGLTYDVMAERAAAAGFPIRRSTLHRVVHVHVQNVPETKVIYAIAAAIGCDPDEVLAAAAESVGIRPRPPAVSRSERALLALISDCSPTEAESLIALGRTFIAALDAAAAAPDRSRRALLVQVDQLQAQLARLHADRPGRRGSVPEQTRAGLSSAG